MQKYTLVLQKHLSKCGLQITTKILIMNQRIFNIYIVVERGYRRTKINFCSLGLTEIVHLIEHVNDNPLLNKKNEFISGCRHLVKLLLKSFK